MLYCRLWLKINSNLIADGHVESAIAAVAHLPCSVFIHTQPRMPLRSTSRSLQPVIDFPVKCPHLHSYFIDARCKCPPSCRARAANRAKHAPQMARPRDRMSSGRQARRHLIVRTASRILLPHFLPHQSSHGAHNGTL